MFSFDPKLTETFTSPTNIAVIKYWGKDNVKLNTPINSSLSVTLDQSDLHTITTISASSTISEDRFWLNGKEVEINGRAKTCLREIRALAQDRIDPLTNTVIVKREDWPKYKLHISSLNTFPTGAGLASSAAGLACFVATLAKLYCVKEVYPGQLSCIARQGSGSASRSMYGGFVKWQMGIKADGSDSMAIQVADHNHWPEMRAVILVVSDKEKDTSSTAGMETSKATSPLLRFRAASVVPDRMTQMERAVLDKDFQTFGKLTMQDSNQFHATCLDTYPPIFYMNDVSKAIIRLVTVLNEFHGRIVAAYTFDAGPNAVIYTLAKDEAQVASAMLKFFPAPGPLVDYCNDPTSLASHIGDNSLIPEALLTRLQSTGRVAVPGDVKYVFLTRAGPGPVLQPLSESLIDVTTGAPKDPGDRHKRMVISSPAKNSTSGSHFLVGAAVAVGVVIGLVVGRHSTAR